MKKVIRLEQILRILFLLTWFLRAEMIKMDIKEKGWEKSVMDGENEKILKVKAAAAASTRTDQKRD